MKNKELLRLSILLLFLGIILITISGRGCPKRSRNRTGNSSEWSLPAPSGLTAVAVSSYQINLSWTANTWGVDGFEIERSMNPATGYSLLATVGRDTISYSDTGLRPFVTYYYRVRAINSIDDRSEWSNVVSATTFMPVWLAVAAGADGTHSLALTIDGTLWAWGNNTNGRLGVGDVINRLAPTQVGTDANWQIIVAGGTHSLALKMDETLWSWGANAFGQLGMGDNQYENWEPFPVMNPITNWAKIAAGAGHSLGLNTNRTLWSWGGNISGQLGLGYMGLPVTIPALIGPDSDWSEVAAGGDYTIALKTNGTLWAWGSNGKGQLGDGTTTQRTTPRQIGTVSDWSNIAGGSSHTISLKTNSTLWAWGLNDYGQLGRSGDATIPGQVGTTSDWSKIAGGYSHTIALKTDSTLWSWGYNNSGQLGLGDTINRNTPSQVGTETDWSAVAAGGAHNISLKRDGTIWAWGLNTFGQLGLGDTTTRNTPSNISNLTLLPMPPISLIVTLFSSSQINLSWTDISYNEAGFKIERKIGREGPWTEIDRVSTDITTYSDITPEGFAPLIIYYYRVKAYNGSGNSEFSNEVAMAISGNWSGVAAGGTHTIATKTNPSDGTGGTLWAWGLNNNGQLGLGNSGPGNYRTTPIQIGSDIDWSAVTAGSNHTIARKSNRTLWAWGDNTLGQLGDGTTTKRLTPRAIGTDSDWSMLTAADNYSLAIKIDSTLWAWGNNQFGQLGIGGTWDPDGGIWLTDNKYTPTQIGTDSDWSTTAAGFTHTLAIKTNSTLWGWGYNYDGELGLGDWDNRVTPAQIGFDSDWSTVAAGSNHTIALKSNGTLWSCGYNEYGQLGLGATDIGEDGYINTLTQIGNDSDWSAISAGQYYTIGLKTNKTIWAWGGGGIDYNYGQLGLGDNTDRNTPIQVGIASDWAEIVVGAGFHTLARKTNGTLWAWGYNMRGQLGLGDTIDRNVPTMVGE